MNTAIPSLSFSGCFRRFSRILALSAFLGAGALFAQSPGTQVWRFPAGADVLAAPTLGKDGRIYVGSEGNLLYAVNPDGTLAWTFTTGDYIHGAVALDQAGNLYFGSWDGFVYSLTPSGTLRWSYETAAYITASPAIVHQSGSGELVCIGSNDGIFYALDSATGEPAWFILGDGPVFAGAAVGPDSTVYFGNEVGQLQAINPDDGSVRWTFSIPEISGRDSRIRCAPVVDASGNVYLGSGNHFLYALDSAGNELWSFEAGDSIDSAPVLDADGNLFFGSRDGFLYKVNSDGSFAWLFETGDIFYASPAVDALGQVYAIGFEGQGISRLYAIDPSGQLLWSLAFDGLHDSSPLLSADGHLYTGLYNGGLYKIYTGQIPAASVWPMSGSQPARSASLDSLFGTSPIVYVGGLNGTAWRGSSWFGWLQSASAPYWNHAQHGWLFAANHNEEDFYFWDYGLQSWIWTSASLYPNIYEYREGRWLYYTLGSTFPVRWFYYHGYLGLNDPFGGYFNEDGRGLP